MGHAASCLATAILARRSSTGGPVRARPRWPRWQTWRMARRFVPLTEVSEVLGISAAQTYALVRSGDLPAIKVGGRGQWRVEVDELDAYIERMYEQTREFVRRGGTEG